MWVKGRTFFYYLTGGRPMKRVVHAFTDRVSGKEIYYFRDGAGLNWLAERPWSLFRVAV